MRKTLAAIVSAAMIGCASPPPAQQQPPQLLTGERVLTPVTPETADLVLTFYEQMLRATDVLPQNIAGHITNLNTLEEKIRSAQKIETDTPPADQLRAIHQHLFDHNAHRYAREAPASELYELAKVQHVIGCDLEKGQQRAGSELGLALELFVLSGRFGLEVTPYLVTEGNTKHIIFTGYGNIVDPTSPTGVRDERPISGEKLTPANLLGLLLNTKGARAVMTGDVSSAYQTFERAYSLFPHEDITMNLAETAVLLEHAPLARKWFEQTASLWRKKYNGNPPLNRGGHIAYERLGDLSSTENDFVSAEKHYKHALEVCSNNGLLYAKYGETLIMLNRGLEAKAFFQRALELEPNNQLLRAGIEQYRDACKVR